MEEKVKLTFEVAGIERYVGSTKQAEVALRGQIKALQDRTREADREIQQLKSMDSQNRQRIQVLSNQSREMKSNVVALKARIQALQEEKKAQQDVNKDTEAAVKAIQGATASLVGYAASISGVVIGLTTLVSAVNASKDAFKEFERSLNTVAAVSEVTAEELKKIEESALDLGQKTIFSNQQVIDSYVELAKAGFTVEESLAAMPALLNLAAAAGGDLAMSSEIVAGSLKAFGLEAQETGRLADVIAQAANKSAADIADMGVAFKQAAPVAHQLGIEVEDTAALLAVLSNNSIKGSDAGTDLRSIFLNLTTDSQDVQRALAAVNVQITDQNGNFKKIIPLLHEFQGALEGVSNKQKAQFAEMLAGKENVKSFLALINTAPEVLDRFATDMENAGGAADKMADTINKGLLKSEMELEGATETLAAKIGKVLAPTFIALNEILTSVIQKISEVFDKMGPAIESLNKATVEVGKFLDKLGLIKLAGDIFINYMDTMRKYSDYFYTSILITTRGLNTLIDTIKEVGSGDVMGALQNLGELASFTKGEILGFADRNGYGPGKNSIEGIQEGVVGGVQALRQGFINAWEGVKNRYMPNMSALQKPERRLNLDKEKKGRKGRSGTKATKSTFDFDELDQLSPILDAQREKLDLLNARYDTVVSKLSQYADASARTQLQIAKLDEESAILAETIGEVSLKLQDELGVNFKNSGEGMALAQKRIMELRTAYETLRQELNGKTANEAQRRQMEHLKESIGKFTELREALKDNSFQLNAVKNRTRELNTELQKQDEDFKKRQRDFENSKVISAQDFAVRQAERQAELSRQKLQNAFGDKDITIDEFFDRLQEVNNTVFAQKLARQDKFLGQLGEEKQRLENILDTVGDNLELKGKILEIEEKINEATIARKDIEEDQKTSNEQLRQNREQQLDQVNKNFKQAIERSVSDAIIAAFSADGPLAAVQGFANAVKNILLKNLADSISQVLTKNLNGIFPGQQTVGGTLQGIRNFGDTAIGKIAGIGIAASSIYGATQAPNKIVGATTGALGGALGGFVVGGPVGAVVGGIAGLIGGIFGGGNRKQKKALYEARLAEIMAERARRAQEINQFIEQTREETQAFNQDFEISNAEPYMAAVLERKFALENLAADTKKALALFTDSQEAQTAILEKETAKRKLIDKEAQDSFKASLQSLEDLLKKRDEIENANVFQRAKSAEQIKFEQLNELDKQIAQALLAVNAQGGAGIALPNIGGASRLLGFANQAASFANQLNITINGATDTNAVTEEVMRAIQEFFRRQGLGDVA